MERLELPDGQRRTLAALANVYREVEAPVSAPDLAETVEFSPNTLRNQMQNLKSLDLVEGVSGPSGGYEPTPKAYDVLGLSRPDEEASTVLAHGYDRIDATVDAIDFPAVSHPDVCLARIRVRRSLAAIDSGDPIVIGPPPGADLALAGVVRTVDAGRNELLVDVERVESPVDGT